VQRPLLLHRTILALQLRRLHATGRRASGEERPPFAEVAFRLMGLDLRRGRGRRQCPERLASANEPRTRGINCCIRATSCSRSTESSRPLCCWAACISLAAWHTGGALLRSLKLRGAWHASA